MKDLCSKLGIGPKNKVCMIHPCREIVSKIRQNAEDVEITINRVERDGDVVLYWIGSAKDIGQRIREIQRFYAALERLRDKALFLLYARLERKEPDVVSLREGEAFGIRG